MTKLAFISTLAAALSLFRPAKKKNKLSFNAGEECPNPECSKKRGKKDYCSAKCKSDHKQALANKRKGH